MNLIKVDKRKKYLDYFDVWSCIDTHDHVEFSVNRTIKMNNTEMLVLDFTHMRRPIKDREFLSRIHDHLQNSYPKAIIQDLRIQCQYAPEIVSYHIAVSTK